MENTSTEHKEQDHERHRQHHHDRDTRVMAFRRVQPGIMATSDFSFTGIRESDGWHLTGPNFSAVAKDRKEAKRLVREAQAA